MSTVQDEITKYEKLEQEAIACSDLAKAAVYYNILREPIMKSYILTEKESI